MYCIFQLLIILTMYKTLLSPFLSPFLLFSSVIIINIIMLFVSYKTTSQFVVVVAAAADTIQFFQLLGVNGEEMGKKEKAEGRR